MKNTIQNQLIKIKNEKRMGIMTHIVLGYPNLNKSIELALTMAKAGVDFIELQIPFSDPMADGPTIMKANQAALDNGFKISQAFEAMKIITSQANIPILFMGYFNTIFNFGVKEFCQEASSSGASGLIFPDFNIDHESDDHLFKFAQKSDLFLVPVFSPASSEKRIRKNLTNSQDGFIYFAARKGVTGSGTTFGLDGQSSETLTIIRRSSQMPVAIGFGISDPSHVASLKDKADIAVIGSKVIDIYNSSDETSKLGNIEKFIYDVLSVV